MDQSLVVVAAAGLGLPEPVEHACALARVGLDVVRFEAMREERHQVVPVAADEGCLLQGLERAAVARVGVEPLPLPVQNRRHRESLPDGSWSHPVETLIVPNSADLTEMNEFDRFFEGLGL
jgi:hypothetical protein